MKHSNETPDTGNKPPKHRTFALVLKPSDPKQDWAFRHILKYENLYKPVYILHDKDRYSPSDLEKWKEQHDGNDPNWSVGDLKEAHYHIQIRFSSPHSASSVSKMLAGLHVEPLSSADGYLLYMIHDNWECEHQREYKHLYSVEDLRGNKDRIHSLNRQNSHFVQLAELTDLLSSTGMDIVDTIHTIVDSDNEDLKHSLLYDNAVRSIWLQAQRQRDAVIARIKMYEKHQ